MNEETISFSELMNANNINDHIQIKLEQNILQFQDIIFENEKELNNKILKLTDIIRSSLEKKITMTFFNTDFTEAKKKDAGNSLEILFINCGFPSLKLSICKTGIRTDDDIDYMIKEMKFKNCIFKDMPFDHACETKVILEKCTVSTLESNNNKDRFECIDCRIKKFSIKEDRHNLNIKLRGGIIENLVIENTSLKSKFYIDSQYVENENQTTIKNLSIKNTIFHESCIFNNFEIENFTIHKSTFEQKFECKENKIESFLIDDSNFTKLVDCYKTEFEKFKIYKSIFDNFVGFEKCVFGSTRKNSEHVAQFEYATFLDFTNFRNTKFLSGLDMEKINLKEYPNFLGSFIEYQNTNRETFRILKYSYDKIGNHIEANKYFSLEMKKHKEELKNKPMKGSFQEKFIFWINEKMSNFGQNFMKPIGLILFFSIIYGLIIYGNEHTWLMNISPEASEILNTIVTCLNYPLKKFRPLEKILKTDYEFMSLMFNIIFSVLIWQTIVAVKRYTKR